MNALEKAAKIAIESDKLTKDWSSASMSQIISHILNTHHVFMKDAMAELEAHLVKEEENLFPMIIEYEQSKNDSLKLKILKFIDDTESEHDTTGDVFKELAKITGDYTAPENAWLPIEEHILF